MDRVFLQGRYFYLITICMSIAIALWILAGNLDLDIKLGMHTAALASVVPVLSGLCFEGKKKGSQTCFCNTVHHKHTYKPMPSPLPRI